jgi:Fur family ferric uptake transcriptional regulator
MRAVAEYPHSTADEIEQDVRTELGAISRQAVYDALAVLVAKGIVRRIEPAGSPARYERRVGDNHHHLVCRSCGRLDDVDCATGEAPCLVPVDGRDFVVDEAEVIYWGTCPDCLAVPTSNSSTPEPRT